MVSRFIQIFAGAVKIAFEIAVNDNYPGCEMLFAGLSCGSYPDSVLYRNFGKQHLLAIVFLNLFNGRIIYQNICE